MRVDRYAGLHPLPADFLEGAVKVRAGLYMYGEMVGAGFPEFPDVPLRLHNHEVNVQRFLGMLLYGLNHRQTQGYIRYKYSIHYVYVKPVGFTGVDHLNIALQVGKVGGENRWS